MINVGYLRNEKHPNEFVDILAKEIATKSIQLIYFTPEDIQIEEKMVSGLVYQNGEWVKEKVRLPWFIDVHADLLGSTRYKESIAFLMENVTLSAKKRFPLPRTQFERYFEEGTFFHDHVILRKKVETVEDIKIEAKRYGKITLQPIQRLEDVSGFIVEYMEEKYKVYRRKDGEMLLEGLADKEVQAVIEKGNYGAERFIQPPNGAWAQADCYVQMEKGAEGAWHIVRMEMDDRAPLQLYVEEVFPENSAVLYQEVEKFVYHFAKTIESIRKSSYMTISINIVLDEEGKIYVRKVIPNPSVVGVEQEVSELRASYYQFIAPPLEMTPEEEAALQKKREEDKKIESELVEIHNEEERKQKLIEQGLLEEEKSKFTIYNVLILVAIVFAVFRMTMRTL